MGAARLEATAPVEPFGTVVPCGRDLAGMARSCAASGRNLGKDVWLVRGKGGIVEVGGPIHARDRPAPLPRMECQPCPRTPDWDWWLV